MDTTQPRDLDPETHSIDAPFPADPATDDPGSGDPGGGTPADDALVPELLAALESADPADAPEIAERLASVLSDELEG